MRYRHPEALTKSVMLGHASQTSEVMQSVHDKPGNLPDPDIFTFDMLRRQPGAQVQILPGREEIRGGAILSKNVPTPESG